MSSHAAGAGGDPEDRRRRFAVAAIILAACTLLLFARLGHYALWDDEALTALVAEGVWATGDTTAVLGHNIVAYRGGALLRGLHDRSTPPLPLYLTAPFVGLLGPTAWAARLPFAACGVACVAIVMAWLARSRAGMPVWFLTALAIVGNASFFLYFRQCRYYGPAMLATVAAAYCYLRRDGRACWRIGFAAASLVLLASNYLSFAALYACLAVDYLVWGRGRPLTRGDCVAAFFFQGVSALALIAVWNPFGRVSVPYRPESWWTEKLTLIWWNFRDANRCELASAALVLAAPFVSLATGRAWPVRAAVALVVYIVFESLGSPQPVGLSEVADVRYLAPIIPLGIALGVLVLREAGRVSWPLAFALAGLAFGTNLLNGAPFNGMPLQSTALCYLGELYRPPPEPYTPAYRWIRRHVPAGKSILVEPSHMVYPLMYHAPGPTYAWQFLEPPPRPDRVASIHIWGRVAPDYIVAFGPIAGELPRRLQAADGSFPYRKVATLDVFWDDCYRPELVWRTFRPITNYDRQREAVYIFAQAGPQAAATPSRGQRPETRR